MGTKIKYALYVLMASALFVPIAFIGGADAVTTTCNEITGVGDSLDNTGSLSVVGSVCVDGAGDVSGTFVSDNIGLVVLDHGRPGYDEVSIDLETGEWSGYAYAPLSAYDAESDYGTWFDMSGVSTDIMSGVSTDILTGDISGEAFSENLGLMSFDGLEEELTPVALVLSVDVEVGTMATTRDDGLPLADGVSGYVVFAEIDFSDFEGVTEAYVTDNLDFSADIYDSGDVRLDQISGGGLENDALNPLFAEFRFFDYDSATKIATYFYPIGSYAPTSDAGCGDVGSEYLEFCMTGDDSYVYEIDSLFVTVELTREFDLVIGGSTESAVPDADGYKAEESVTVAEQLSWAPWIEVDNFSINTQVEEWEDVPELTEGGTYKFVGDIVKNGLESPGALKWGIEFLLNDYSDFTFNERAACGVSDFYEEALVFPYVGMVEGWGELCGEGDTDGLIAYGASYVVVDHGAGIKAKYYSEYFGLGAFIDNRADIADPRYKIIGTVSGLAGGDDVTVVGNVNRLELRDVVFEQVMKVIRGISSSTVGGGVVDSDWDAFRGGQELISDTVLYFTGNEGDVVTIEGGSIDAITKTILVVGADVYIEGDVYRTGEDGELGIIVLADDGHGGNLYVNKNITDLHANIFLDGSLFRADSGGNLYSIDELVNQFYLWGSLISQNTIEGIDEGLCGDGSACANPEYYDLQMASSFVVCYPYIEGEMFPEVDYEGDFEECDGYAKSDYLFENQNGYWTTPVVIEYRPPSEDLPMFNVSGSVVR